MDLDKKSKFVVMHQMGMIQQMLEFAKKAIGLELVLSLNSDFSGIITHKMELGNKKEFADVTGAMNAVQEMIEKAIAKRLDHHNKDIKSLAKKVEKINDERKKLVEIGERVLEKKFTIHEKPIVAIDKEDLGQTDMCRCSLCSKTQGSNSV
jgi:hypothetical protein